MIFKGSVFASKEGVAGLLCIMLGALFTYVFIENGTLSKRSKSFLEPSGIGHLQPLSDGVRLRSIDSAIWQDVPSKHKKEVGLGDAIFTSKNASARVGMKDGTEVVIQPASMVVFSKPKKIKGSVSVERNVIQVKKGQVKLSVKKNASIPVVIEVSGKNYEIPVKDIASDAERTLLV